jgi:4-hydroxybenzoate polyprenyltransferase
LKRWWVYQRERFPVLGHGPLIAAFSFCAVSVSALLRGSETLPGVAKLAVAFVTCLLFFLQLRIADECKDFAEDARWRPYRPVPRGLVSLRELRWLFIAAAVVQLMLALWLEWRLVGLLAVTWAYLALMYKEFFVRDWLKRWPIVYMVSHMAIMPLIDLFATGTDWLVEGTGPPAGLAAFLLASFFNGMVIEVGRKLRSPADEEKGVETYTALWGRPVALAAWWGVMLTTALCGVWVGVSLGTPGFIAGVLGVFLLVSAAIAAWFVRDPRPQRGKVLEAVSGVWTLVLYVVLGAWPWLAKELA